jgi:capsular polysaccharide biosynthesis protein
MSNEITKHRVTMRSKTTFKTDTQVIEVHPGQDVQEVAERIAEGYGATVEGVVAV